MAVKLELYRVFKEVAETGNISAAAKNLYISQSAVSQSIKQLETALQARLFARSPRGVTLTGEGQMLYQYVRNALGLLATGEDKLSQAQQLLLGTLTIGASDTVTGQFLTPYLDEFHHQHPGIRLKIVSGRSAKVVSMLRSGAVDIAFASSPKDSTLETWPCFATHSVFVAGKNYHCDFDKIYTRQEMAEFPLILLERKASSRVFLEQEFLKAGVTLTPEIELSSRQLLVTLAGILSNAELLEGAGLAEKPARWSGNIHTEAEQMRTLVEQMLTLARADNGVRPAAMEPLNLSDVATDCVLAFEPVAFEAGKPLEERITADVTVVGDADRLRRLISILLDNAVKYGAEGGHITLTLEKMDRQARLTVSNPGDPIPPEHLAHLFERFYRADASRGEKSGFGLGLAIADTIAREHKGALKAESDAASTRFIFTMPLKKQA